MESLHKQLQQNVATTDKWMGWTNLVKKYGQWHYDALITEYW